MTRFGVMKHLKQLEEAGLVVTRRRGREKLHFLNPVPIRLVHDRWVSKYAEPWVAGLSDLKQKLEQLHGKGLRDLHQDDPRPTVAGDHRSRDPREVQLRRERRRRTGRPDRAWSWRRRRLRARRGRGARGRSARMVHLARSQRGDGRALARVDWDVERSAPCVRTLTHDQSAIGANSQLVRRLADGLSRLETWSGPAALTTSRLARRRRTVRAVDATCELVHDRDRDARARADVPQVASRADRRVSCVDAPPRRSVHDDTLVHRIEFHVGSVSDRFALRRAPARRGGGR